MIAALIIAEVAFWACLAHAGEAGFFHGFSAFYVAFSLVFIVAISMPLMWWGIDVWLTRPESKRVR